jgi:hypothetical protein
MPILTFKANDEEAVDSSREVLSGDSAQSNIGYCVWWIAQITLASRDRNFTNDLKDRGSFWRK